MPVAAVTRLRLRHIGCLPRFIWYTLTIQRQANRHDGLLHMKLRRTEGLCFWTLSVWQDDQAMMSFRDSGAHRRAMPRLRRMTRNADVAHWLVAHTHIPDWAEAEQSLAHALLEEIDNSSDSD